MVLRMLAMGDRVIVHFRSKSEAISIVIDSRLDMARRLNQPMIAAK
jgi:primosomal protein N'